MHLHTLVAEEGFGMLLDSDDEYDAMMLRVILIMSLILFK